MLYRRKNPDKVKNLRKAQILNITSCKYSRRKFNWMSETYKYYADTLKYKGNYY